MKQTSLHHFIRIFLNHSQRKKTILKEIQEVENVDLPDESETDKTEDDASFVSEVIISQNEEVSQKSISMGLHIPQIPDAIFLAPDVMDFNFF